MSSAKLRNFFRLTRKKTYEGLTTDTFPQITGK